MVMHKVRECHNCNDCEIKSPLFQHLSNEDLEIMNRERFVVRYQPGELLFKQGSSYTHVIVLITGLLKCTIESAARDLLLNVAKPVEVITGPGLFTDLKHHYSASALTHVEACCIPLNHLKEVFRRNPAFAEDVSREIDARRLFSFQRLVTLTQKHVHGRVAEALLYFSNHIYESQAFQLDISRQELADLCSVTKESAIRVLKELKDEGLIVIEGNNIEIIDYQMIEKISNLG